MQSSLLSLFTNPRLRLCAAIPLAPSLTQIVAGLETEAVSAALPQFTRLLTQALDFRRQHASGSAPQARASADLVESESSSALVCLVMRLSEVELRPLFLHLCEWKAGVSTGANKKAALAVLDRRLSFYKVLDGLAGALKVRRRHVLNPVGAKRLHFRAQDTCQSKGLSDSFLNGQVPRPLDQALITLLLLLLFLFLHRASSRRTSRTF